MRRIVFLLSILLTAIGVSAQQTVTVKAQSYQVSDNLDLEAVAITFGESKNVEDFERRLNNPDNRISNLDLNNDGYIDFLRVVEVEEHSTHLIVIQAVIGQDLYQDVATVIVEGENKTSVTITIVGNRNIYGDNYVIIPRYVVRPVIFDWFWLPTYAVYRSVWYWDYYPKYYRHHVCLGYHSYHRHIHVWHTRHHNHCEFHRPTHHEPKPHHVEMYRGVVRNDYVTHRPNQGYRAEPTPNRHVEARPNTPITQSRTTGQAIRTTNNRSTSTISVKNTTSQSRSINPTNSSSQSRHTTSTTVTTNVKPTTSTTRKATSTTAVKQKISTPRQSSKTIRSTTATRKPASTTAVKSSTSTARKTTAIKTNNTTQKVRR